MGGDSFTGSSNTFEPGQWYHIALIVDSSGNGKLFVNGGQEATCSNGSNTSVSKFSIGQEYDNNNATTDFFNGKIDEVAIWNVVLSVVDVTALYNSGNGLKTSADSENYDNSGDLVGYWKFNSCSDTDGDNMESVFTKDMLLTNIMVYLITKTINSASWIYYGRREEGGRLLSPDGKRVEVPTAAALFSAEILSWPLRSYVERIYNIARWTKMPYGGHFAELEQPMLLIEDIRAFASTLR